MKKQKLNMEVHKAYLGYFNGYTDFGINRFVKQRINREVRRKSKSEMAYLRFDGRADDYKKVYA